ncbi:hypothetical protein DCS_06414 [Drechmeria coniospora]|uniref:Uncharacterized protein n=1 Tax=Drechmeria coniospora TaxID=98403 RepID=A0A151GBF5_DRECN|nr:hypothetical protein DCS_06414 [Drechmeria coniospora]KYK54456.1 hypothetical protein DCS_06414 [Drechmeria coniospora]ODA77265.1 hypothetical protein RJ55_06892 [Drechmeria coniospora]
MATPCIGDQIIPNETNIGAIVILTAPEEGENVWIATQTEVAHNLPPPAPGRGKGRKEFSWSFGPVKLTGYIDTDTYEIGLIISVLGINLGNIYGNIKEGVVVKVNLGLAKGQLKFYLKNGNELWVHIDIKVLFDGSFHGDYKIISW